MKLSIYTLIFFLYPGLKYSLELKAFLLKQVPITAILIGFFPTTWRSEINNERFDLPFVKNFDSELFKKIDSVSKYLNTYLYFFHQS